MSFFIQDAYAAADSAASTSDSAMSSTLGAVQSASATAPASDGTFSILMMVAMIVIFYLLLWRPQSKRAKEHRNLISNLQKDDEVVTSGGIVGKITQIEEKFISIAIAPSVEIKLQRSAISSVLPKGSAKAA